MRAQVVDDLAAGVIGLVALAGVTLGGYAVAAGWAQGWSALYAAGYGYGDVCRVYPGMDTGDPGDPCSLSFLDANSRRR
jgi:hypothetical protein